MGTIDIIPKMVLGTAQFGMSYGIANAVGRVRFREVVRILDLAWSSFDLALIYV